MCDTWVSHEAHARAQVQQRSVKGKACQGCRIICHGPKKSLLVSQCQTPNMTEQYVSVSTGAIKGYTATRSMSEHVHERGTCHKKEHVTRSMSVHRCHKGTHHTARTGARSLATTEGGHKHLAQGTWVPLEGFSISLVSGTSLNLCSGIPEPFTH